MAKDNKPQPPASDVEKTYSCAIVIHNRHLRAIDRHVEGDVPIQTKIELLAQQFISDMLAGGMILQSNECNKLNEVLGKEAFPSDIIEQFQRGVGRREGKLQIMISLDPAYEGVAQAAADFQGITIHDLLQRAWDTAWDNGDFYDPRVSTERVLMTHEDKKELAAILGKDFANGTELAALVKQYAADHEGLFDEVTK